MQKIFEPIQLDYFQSKNSYGRLMTLRTFDLIVLVFSHNYVHQGLQYALMLSDNSILNVVTWKLPNTNMYMFINIVSYSFQINIRVINERRSGCFQFMWWFSKKPIFCNTHQLKLNVFMKLFSLDNLQCAPLFPWET